MKLLLCKNVSNLGIVGDIVDVASGYGRNYLVPCGLATEPTKANIKRLAHARLLAEQERIRNRQLLEEFAKRLDGVEVTVRARANEEGVLYGSVGPREIAAALNEEGYPVEQDHVAMDTPIRRLDNVAVEIHFGEGLRSSVKVWVVRERTEREKASSGSRGGEDGMEADANDHDRPIE